jgi:hypothetical protein
MSFPTSPTNGQTTVVNGVTYIFESVNRTWTRLTSADLTIAGNLTAANVIATANTTTNKLYVTTGLFWSGNGSSINGSPGGAVNTIQYNNAGTFDGTSLFYDSTTGNIVLEDTTGSNSSVTGALVVKGGIGVGGNIYTNTTANIITGNVYTTGIFWSNGTPYISGGGVGTPGGLDTQLQFNNGGSFNGANITFSQSNGNVVISSVTPSANTTTGAFVVRGGMGVAGNAYIGGNVILGAGATSNVVIAATTASGNITSGALVVAGGVGIAGNLYANGNVFLGAGANSNLVANATTVSTSITTGAFVVRGGMGVAGNIFADGNIVLGSGATSNLVANATTTSGNITSGALVVRGGMGVAGNAHIGGNVILGTGTTSNVVINATTSALTTTTGALVVRGGVGVAGVIYSGGNIFAAAGTASTNTTSGALVVSGGIGATGAAYIGAGIQNTAVGNVTASTGAFTTLSATGQVTFSVANPSTTPGSGALVISNGGLGVAGNAYIGGVLDATGNIVADSGVASTSSTTGALIVNGGAGVSGNLFVVGNVVLGSGTSSNLVANATTTSRSTTTGALVVRGGMGVAGNVYSGNVYTTSGVYWAGNNEVYGSQFDFTSSSSAPSSPTVGDFWYDTVGDIIFQYANDGTSSYWIDVQTPTNYANVGYDNTTSNLAVGGNLTVLGNTVMQSNVVLNNSIVEKVYTITDTAGLSITPLNGTMQLWTLGTSRSPTLAPFFEGHSMTLIITAGSYTITWSGVTWITGSAPTLSTTTTTIIEFWKAGGTLYGGLVGIT